MKFHFRIVCIALIIIIAAGFSSCNQRAQENADTTAEPANENDDLTSTDVVENATAITFDHDTFDFGEIKEGTVVKHDFKFTNTGTHDLVISEARKTCGCTVTDWPKHPIKPGESDYIKIEYNSKNREGAIHKTITVVANTNPNETKLYINGTVLK